MPEQENYPVEVISLPEFTMFGMPAGKQFRLILWADGAVTWEHADA